MKRILYAALLVVTIISAACRPTAPVSTATGTGTSELITASAGAAGVGDLLYPGFGNGGYDVQHYTLDLNVSDVNTSTLSAVTTIEAQATQNLSSLNLDFIGFTIDAITTNGQPAGYVRDGQELTITPVAPLHAGETFTVEVSFHGVPEQITSVAIPVPTGWVIFDGGSFVVSEPDGAANYYPVNDHPLDKATYTFRVTVPKPFEVAANGVLTESVDNGNTTTFVWEARDPMASYLTTVNISEFEVEIDASPNGIPIRNYYAIGLPPAIRTAFARQGEMLDFYGEIIGTYPFEVYGSVVMNTDVGTAMEMQTMSVFGVDQFALSDIRAGEYMVAHELAHQWFGNSVSLADWSDIWLNESFATYAEWLWIDHTQESTLDEIVEYAYGRLVKYHDFWYPPGMPRADDLFNGGVYSWGALALHALRLKVGDEVFFDILARYFERFNGGNATTGDFVAITEEISGQDLASFFESWLYSETVGPIPEMELSPE